MGMQFPRVNKSVNSNDKTELLTITLLVILFTLTGTVLSITVATIFGVKLGNLNGLFEDRSLYAGRMLVRVFAAIHQVFTFILPCFFFWWIIKRKVGSDYFRLSRVPLPKNLLFGFLFLSVSLPLVGLSGWLNQFLPLPEWATSAEADTAKMITLLLTVDTPLELLFNVLVIAAIPAVGEELFFRGVVQSKLVGYCNNPHLAIWLGAFFFSAFHVQFEGLFPRMVLGAVLGYLYYWSKNLWIPIILHFFNNAMLVSAPFFGVEDTLAATEQTMSMTMMLVIIFSLVALSFLIKNKTFFLERTTD